jgi:outer membrane protein assembly factor BamB
MSHNVAFLPPSRDPHEPRDLVYREPSSGRRALFVLMQDALPQGGDARGHFLRACFRHAVRRYLATDRVAGPSVFLRDCVSAFDAVSRAVDTRLDDYDSLGMFVIVREPGSMHVLCARGASARVRWRGVFVPLATPDVEGVTELPIDTSRSQHDLFAQTFPETRALYRIDALSSGSGERELLLGGTAEDMGAVIDLLQEPRTGSARDITAERVSHTVLMLSLEARPGAGASAPATPDERPKIVRRPARAAVIGAAGLVVIAAAVAGIAAWRGGSNGQRARDGVAHTAAKQTPAPPPPQERVIEDVAQEQRRAAEEAAAEEAAVEEAAKGFGVAWQQSYRAAVTSSPAHAGDAVIFGGRDGRVYSVHRESGKTQWSYAARGGVGASPVVRGATVIAADYAGNVVRLRAGDGGVVWKRALGEKVVSTPGVSGERVLVGTTKGRIYALSLETGRVLWKWAARGPVRGSIAYADGVFLVPSNDGRLYAMVEETGARRWMLPLGGPVTSSPASDGEIVVIGSSRGEIIAVDFAKGKQIWKQRAGGAVNSSLALEDGRVFAGAGDQRLYCMDARTGEIAWRFDTGGAILSRPFVHDGRVMVTSYDGAVYCLDAGTGELVDRYETGESIFSSPLVVDGRVFFGNNAGQFYCLDIPSPRS